MKKLSVLLVGLALFVGVLNAEDVTKKGFLTSKWCAQRGYFSDCRLESFVCGSGDCFKRWEFGDTVIDEVVLFVHDENKLYTIDYHGMPRYLLDEPMNRNDVSIIGELNGDTIVAKSFKAPPPPEKSFFKGCL